MRKRIFYALLLSGGMWAEDGLSATLSERCTPYSPAETPVYRDARIFHSRQELEDQFNQLYDSGHRLKARAYYDSLTSSVQIPYRNGSIEAPDLFVQGLIRHIELAHKNSYVDYVYYPDMGHGHLYLPREEWTQLKRIQDLAQRMEKVLQSENLKVLYHTVEALQVKEGDFVSGTFPNDPWKLWRYFSRNLLGNFRAEPGIEVLFAGSDQVYNTVRKMDGHTQITVLYMSSSKDGCLPYDAKGRTYHFDFTLEGPSYEPPKAQQSRKTL